ncbi:hypothetical protein HanLR1_Chr03g0092881 [Helianthus annuus]|nr:hypothetical protein HanLR1_Chr03g0092881 [Helianthus annuus]
MACLIDGRKYESGCTHHNPTIIKRFISSSLKSDSRLGSAASRRSPVPYSSQTHSINRTCFSGALNSIGFRPQAISNATTPKLKTSDSLDALPVITHSGAI